MVLRPRLAFSRKGADVLPNGLLADGIQAKDRADLQQVLEELGARVETAVQLHRALTEQLSDTTVELGAYLQDFSGAIVAASVPVGRLELRFDCEDLCHLPANRALAAALIVVELVTNATRHAHPAGVEGVIRIGCHRASDGRLCIVVDDDGVGLPEGFDPRADGGLGLRLVRMLSAQLGGQVGFASSPLGLSVIVQVPSEEPA